jgi:hypothetical protein
MTRSRAKKLEQEQDKGKFKNQPAKKISAKTA